MILLTAPFRAFLVNDVKDYDALILITLNIECRKGTLFVLMISVKARAYRWILIRYWGTLMMTGLDSVNLLLVDELWSLVTSFPCENSSIIVSFDVNTVFLMHFLFSHLLNLRSGTPPILLARDFTSLASFASLDVRFLMLYSEVCTNE